MLVIPGTENTESAVIFPSLSAALMLNTFATEPGSYASTAAKLPVAMIAAPLSSRRTLDIA